MEQSKSISIIIAKLKIAYPYYFKDLTDEEFLGLISMYQEELSFYNDATLQEAVKLIIRKNKFMPTIKELIDACEISRTNKKNFIIEKMKSAGYFKHPSEIDKAYTFVESGIIPEWFLEDMKKYGYDDTPLLNNRTNYKMIETNGGEI